jgi:hypothetical protein
MAQNIAAYQIASPGFFGINTEDSPVDLSSNFASIAYNCIIDHYGRIGSRMGWSKLHTTNADINISNIECIGELIQNDGTAITLSAGNGYFFTHTGTTLSTLVYDGGGVAPTISANNWQFVQLNGLGLFFQRGYDPIIFDPARPTKFRRLNEQSGHNGTELQANCALSAFGRIWCADTPTDKNTIKWSNIITPQEWTAGSSGSINMLGVWPKGGDEVVALASHNNFLIVFGKRQIVIYQGAQTPTASPATMVLYDTIDSLGCIARDSVQNTGEDIIFLSSHGVMSLNRIIQEKSSPINNLSKNIRTDLQALLNNETLANIKSIYSPIDAFYLLSLPFCGLTYCFDTRRLLEEGVARVTIWTDIEPTSFCYMASLRKLYLGKAGFLAEHTGYLDDTSVYRMAYFSTWIDLGNKIQRSTLKKLKASIIGISSQSIIIKYGFDYLETFRNAVVLLTNNVITSTFNVSQFNIDKYSTGKNTSILDQNIGGNGKSCKIGIETDINGYQVSIQQIELFTKDGKL